MFEGAAAVLNKLAKRNPSDGELYFRLAAGLDAAGELAAAKSACETAVLTAPKSRWAWNLLAKLRLRDGDIARALACQDLAILIHPDRLYYGHKARILERFGRFEEACECGSRAVEMAPHNAADWHSYAKALRSRGRPQEAATAARETLRLAPLPFYASFLDEIEKEAATIAVAPAP